MPTITGQVAGQTGFRELFDSYYPVICRQLTCLLGSRAAAEDVAQETFIKLYQSPPPGTLQFGRVADQGIGQSGL
jgi:DNA-directed RNA polymerase specialized sigma24 family protein